MNYLRIDVNVDNITIAYEGVVDWTDSGQDERMYYIGDVTGAFEKYDFYAYMLEKYKGTPEETAILAFMLTDI